MEFPAFIPVTIPVDASILMFVLLRLHVPPGNVLSRSMVLPPSQTTDGPVMAGGSAFIVIDLVT